jgi:hypothetical protein
MGWMGSPVKQLRVQGGTKMVRQQISEAEWETFLGVADRLGIPVRELFQGRPNFTEMESAGHRLGQAVARAATERLTLARAGRMTEPQPCPTCGQVCAVEHRERELATIDGPLVLCEPVSHCPACRRDFFPSACGVGSVSKDVQSRGDRQDSLGERGVEVGRQSAEAVAQAGGDRRQRALD